MKKVIDLIDINSIKSEEIRRALKSKKFKKGILDIINTSTQVDDEFIKELNTILKEYEDIKELTIHSISPIANIEFDKIASEKLEKIDLVCNSKIESDIFSKLIERQTNLKYLRLNGEIDSLAFLNSANENFKDFYVIPEKTQILSPITIEDYLKYKLYKTGAEVQLPAWDVNRFNGMQLSEYAYYWEKYSSEYFPQFKKNQWAVIGYIENENCDMTVDDYIQLNRFVHFKELEDGVKRRIFFDKDISIEQRYLAWAKEICNDENFVLALTLEQAEAFDEELGEDVNVQIYCENAEDVQKLIDSKKLPKCVKEVKIEVSKEQAFELAKNETLKETNSPIDLKIKSAADLSIEELDELTKKIQINTISMDDINLQIYQKEPYSIADYRACRMIIDELLDGIDIGQADDLDREKKIFGQVIKRLANHISYDYSALKLIKTKKEEIEYTSVNMLGGLIDGKCVCAGYAEIVRNVFACAGIEARYVAGYQKAIIGNGKFEINGKKYGDGHAWNQIKLDGVWYNIDLTWASDNINASFLPFYMLKNDKDFGHKTFDTQVIKASLEECPHTVKMQDLNKYIYGYENLAEHIVGEAKNTINGIGSKLKSLWDKFSIGETDIVEAYRILAKTKENKKSINEIDEK